MEQLKKQKVLQIEENLKHKMQNLLGEENKHVQDEKELLTMDTCVRDFKFPFKKVTDILADALKVRIHEYRSPIFYEGVEEYDGAEYYFYIEGNNVSIDCYSTLNSIISRVGEAFFKEKDEMQFSSLMVDREYIEDIYKKISTHVSEEVGIFNEEWAFDSPISMDVPMGYIDDDIFRIIGAVMEEVLGIEQVIDEGSPKMNVDGDGIYYYFDIGIQRIEITRTKTINQLIWETVSVIADEIISKVTEEKLWEHFFKEPCKYDWYRLDGNTIQVKCEDIGYLLCIVLDCDRWCNSQMEELLTQNGYEVREGCYADYPCKYISFPEMVDMADGAGDRIWLEKCKFERGWFPDSRPRIEVLTLLSYITGYYW